MDLQAILDGSSSSSDDDDNDVVVGRSMAASSYQQQQQRYVPSSAPAPPRLDYTHYQDHYTSAATAATSSNTAVDLEQILREDDDEEDDDELDVDGVSAPPPWMMSSSATTPSRSSGGGSAVENLYQQSSEPTGVYTSTTSTAANNPEDWDILQAILGEDDDDDDDDDANDVVMGMMMSPLSTTTDLRRQPRGVDQVIGMDDDDDDDDDDWNMYNNKSSTHSTTKASSSKRQNRLVDSILNQQSEEDDDLDSSMMMMNRSMSTTATSQRQRYYNDNDDSDNNNPSFASSSVRRAPSPIVTTDTHDLTDSQDNLAATDSFVTAAQSAVTPVRSGEESIPTVASSSSQLDASSRGMRGNRSIPLVGGSGPAGAAPTLMPSATSSSEGIVGPTTTTATHSNNTSPSASHTQLLQVRSKKSLQYAQTYERKLLRSGHRDIVSPLMVKRRLKPKIELGSKTQQQQQQNSTTTTFATSKKKTTATTPAAATTPRGVSFFNFSGVVENKIMTNVSKALATAAANSVIRNKGNMNKKDLPTALTVNSRFIAVGSQHGKIQVFDLFEVLRQRLNTPKLESHPKRPSAGAVTSMDLSMHQGELLLAGHASGLIVLWDVLKAQVLRTVIETVSPSPITSIRFVQDLKCVSVDASGLVNKLNFSKNILFANYSVESECLLDGTAGQILAMNVLLARPAAAGGGNRSAAAAPNKSKIVLIALSSERSSFAVAVEPSVHVLHRWARPPPEKVEPTSTFAANSDSQVYLPCLSWGWALVSGGGHQVTPILARAWGCCLQLLRANFPEDDTDDRGMFLPTGDGGANAIQWPAFGVHDEFQVMAPIVAMEWLNDRSLVYLTVTNEFTVIDTVMMTLLERLDFSGLQLVFAEFSLSRKAQQTADKEVAVSQNLFCTTFQNSFRSCDDRLFFLCQEALTSVSVVGAKQRISGLEQDGEWLEALALALDHYENTISSQQDRRRVLKKDLSKHPEYSHGAQISEDEEWISKLLIRYLNTAVENAPETIMDTSFGNQSKEWMQSQVELAQSHFQMLAGVCVEFCVVTKRLDLLFGPIFRRFQAVGYLHVFLDVLEPYVLNDKLDYIAPEAMAHFVEHCRATNGIATVERCLLHMDVTIMDFDSILSLLKANEMYSALFYVFNQGLDDYTTPLEILMEKIFDAADMVGTNGIGGFDQANVRRPDGVPQNDFERFGYKAILYLQSCFQGHTFPQDANMSEDRLKTDVRPQLLKFLLQKQFSPSPSSGSSLHDDNNVFGQRAVPYPYTHILLMVDPKLMFDTISLAMNAPDSDFRDDSTALVESIGGWQVEVDAGGNSSSDDQTPAHEKAPDRQEIISMLSAIIIPDESDIAMTRQTTLYKSKVAVNCFLDFLAAYLMKGVIRANRSITLMILNRMANRYSEAREPQDRISSQQQLLQLLTALPRNAYDPEEVLGLVQRAGIHRAALLLHQEGASVWAHGTTTTKRRAEHFIAAIDCYLDDDDVEFRKEVFPYVKKECSAAGLSADDNNDASAGSDGEGGTRQSPPGDALRDGLTLKLAELIHLDALMTAEVVAELFVEDLDKVIASLGGDEDAQFMLFQAVISGDLMDMDQVAGGVLNAHLTMEHHHKYLALMAKLHPELVYDYLSSHDNYRPEECLKLCQKYEIADASAYLLERMGNVSSALQLILQTLESRMMGLKRTIRGMGTDFFTKYHTSRKMNHRGGTKKGGGFAPGSTGAVLYGKQEQEINGVKRILVVALDLCERNSGSYSSRTEHGSQLWFNVLDRLINAKGFLRLSKEQPGHAKVMAGVLSELLRLTMQRMVSSVPLPDLVRKVTSDHSGSRLGELREMIESLLSTYGLELNVFSGAVKVFHYDSQQMQKKHRQLRIRGAAVNSVMNIPLADSTNNKQNDAAMASLLAAGGNNNTVLQLSEYRHASIVDSQGRATTKAPEQGFGNSLAKLRSRRMAASQQSSRPMDRCRATGLNFMTSNDMSLRRGQVSPDVTYFEDRVSGTLGDAEHRGRLMSFTY